MTENVYVLLNVLVPSKHVVYLKTGGYENL